MYLFLKHAVFLVIFYPIADDKCFIPGYDKLGWPGYKVIFFSFSYISGFPPFSFAFLPKFLKNWVLCVITIIIYIIFIDN